MSVPSGLSAPNRKSGALVAADVESIARAAPGNGKRVRYLLDYIDVPPNPRKRANTQSTAGTAVASTLNGVSATAQVPPPQNTTAVTTARPNRVFPEHLEDPPRGKDTSDAVPLLNSRQKRKFKEHGATTSQIGKGKSGANPNEGEGTDIAGNPGGDEEADWTPSNISSDEESSGRDFTDEEDEESSGRDFTDEEDEDWEERDTRRDSGTLEKLPPLSEEELKRLLFGAEQLNSQSSQFVQNMSGLSYDPASRTFKFRNKTCTHNLLDGASESPFCAVLDALGLEWCAQLKHCIDVRKKSMLLLTGLQRVFEAAVQATTSTTLTDDVMLKHIRDAYPLSDETVEQVDNRFRTITLEAALGSLRPPVLHDQCRECGEWVVAMSTHHHRKHRGIKRRDTLVRGWFILPLGKGSGCRAWYHHNVKIKVSSRTVQDPRTVAADRSAEHVRDEAHVRRTIPSYARNLAWLLYLKSVIKELPIFFSAQALMERHSKVWLNPLKTGPNRMETCHTVEAVELSLPHLRESIVKYLVLADQRLLSSHESVRELVTQGQKGMFRSIVSGTRQNYARFAERAVTVALRWVAGVREGHPVTRLLQDGKWSPDWKPGQMEQCEEFLGDIIETFGKKRAKEEWPGIQEAFQLQCLSFIHRFLSTAFTGDFHTSKPVDSIIEQVILFHSFSKYAGWRPAHLVVQGPLLGFQYVSRSVLVHCAFLGGRERPWKMPSEGDGEIIGGIEGEEDEDEDEDEEDDDINVDEPAWDILASTPPSKENTDTKLSSTFTELAQYFKSTNSEFQWGRCSTMWTYMLASARHQPSSTVVQWNVAGGVNFDFKAKYCRITVDLDDYRASIKQLPEAVWSSFIALFPSDYPTETLIALSNLTVASFKDNITSEESLFARPENIAIFDQYLKPLEQCLAGDQGWFASYPSRLRKFLTVLSQGIMMPNGIAMRAFQLAGLKFSASGALPRSVYLNGGVCYVGKPEAKQQFHTKKYYDAYWLLEDLIGLALLLYGGLFRHIESQHFAKTPALLKSILPFIFINLSTDEHNAHVFTPWRGADVNKSLAQAPSPLKAEARVQRHFGKGLLRRFMSETASRIALDNQQDNSLGWDDPRNVERRREQQLLLSRAVHELFGLRPSSLSASPKPVYKDQGLALARHLARYRYKLYGDDIQGIQSKAAKLLLEMPFLCGVEDSNEATDVFGDGVLVEVASAVLYGPSQPGAFEAMPFDGYPVEHIALSVTIIWSAIQEWSQGIQSSGRFTEASFSAAQKLFDVKTAEIRAQNQRAYLRFCTRVYEHAGKLELSLQERPSLHTVPQTQLMPFHLEVEERVAAQIPRLIRKSVN